MSAPGDLSNEVEAWLRGQQAERPMVAEHYAWVAEHPVLRSVARDLARAYDALVASFESGGTLFLCGNGGSLSDALHISGELLKRFVRPRPLPEALHRRLLAQPLGEELAAHLQAGLPAYVLGVNPALSSAVANDIALPGIGYAQELVALGRPGDVLFGISTSGRALNVRYAVSVAKAIGMTTVGLTGQAPNPLAGAVDIALAVPEGETYRIQELHLALYHALCLMVEARFF